MSGEVLGPQTWYFAPGWHSATICRAVPCAEDVGDSRQNTEPTGLASAPAPMIAVTKDVTGSTKRLLVPRNRVTETVVLDPDSRWCVPTPGCKVLAQLSLAVSTNWPPCPCQPLPSPPAVLCRTPKYEFD